MSTWFTRCATALVMAALPSANALADPIPPGGQGDRLKVIGFSGLGGHYGAFKMALNHPARRSVLVRRASNVRGYPHPPPPTSGQRPTRLIVHIGQRTRNERTCREAPPAVQSKRKHWPRRSQRPAARLPTL